jgi:hypothetical protein
MSAAWDWFTAVVVFWSAMDVAGTVAAAGCHGLEQH